MGHAAGALVSGSDQVQGWYHQRLAWRACGIGFSLAFLWMMLGNCHRAAVCWSERRSGGASLWSVHGGETGRLAGADGWWSPAFDLRGSLQAFGVVGRTERRRVMLLCGPMGMSIWASLANLLPGESCGARRRLRFGSVRGSRFLDQFSGRPGGMEVGGGV